MTKKIKWGIIGLGKIAHKFASDLLLSESGTLYAVASRSEAKAKEFSKKYKAEHYYNSYEALVADSEVDVVYIATPHPYHFDNSMLCLSNGKAVLCEKPMGMDAQEVIQMKEIATANGLFLMEGLWTRFIPATEKLLTLLQQKAIGDVLFLHADFGFKAAVDLDGRLYNKKLGGGTLLDIGIYPIYLSLLLLGIPKNIKAMARMTSTGVDSYCSMLFDYSNDTKAILEATIEADTPTQAAIYGTEGVLKLHRRFHHSEKISLYKNGALKEVYELPFKGKGYVHEIEEVNNCLLQKQTESSKLPLQTSLDLITIIDQVKAQIGLNYN